MLEYIFFNKKTCHLFEKTAISAGIKPVINYADECFTVTIPEDLDEVILEKLEDDYDELMDIDRDLTEQQDSVDDIHAAGITIQLKDGRFVYASVTPELLNKVMQSISADELNTLVCAITEAVENPDERGLCQR
ncbi:MAG: hypothetical protein ACNYZG_07620 [Gammaproteobacteria bacterium]